MNEIHTKTRLSYDPISDSSERFEIACNRLGQPVGPKLVTNIVELLEASDQQLMIGKSYNSIKRLAKKDLMPDTRSLAALFQVLIDGTKAPYKALEIAIWVRTGLKNPFHSQRIPAMAGSSPALRRGAAICFTKMSSVRGAESAVQDSKEVIVDQLTKIAREQGLETEADMSSNKIFQIVADAIIAIKIAEKLTAI